MKNPGSLRKLCLAATYHSWYGLFANTETLVKSLERKVCRGTPINPAINLSPLSILLLLFSKPFLRQRRDEIKLREMRTK